MATIRNNGTANGFTKLVLSNLGTIQTPSVQTAFRQVMLWSNNIATPTPSPGDILTAVTETTSKSGPVAKWTAAPSNVTTHCLYEVIGSMGNFYYTATTHTHCQWHTSTISSTNILYQTGTFDPISFEADQEYVDIKNDTKYPVMASANYTMTLHRATTSVDLCIQVAGSYFAGNYTNSYTTGTTTHFIYIPSTIDTTPITMDMKIPCIWVRRFFAPTISMWHGTRAIKSTSACSFRLIVMVFK